METMHIVEQLLKDKGIDQKEFCRLIGVVPQVFSDWKSGRNKSYHKYIGKMADNLGISADDLLGQAKRKPSTNEDTELGIQLKKTMQKIKSLDESVLPDVDKYIDYLLSLRQDGKQNH